MEIRVKKEGLGISSIMILVVLLWYHCFYLFPYPNFLKNILKQSNLIIFIVIFGIISTVYCFKYYANYLNKYRKWLKNYLIIVICTYFLIFLYSLFKYPDQSFAALLRVGVEYLSPFLVPVFIVIFEKDKTEKLFFNCLNFLMFVWYIVIIIQTIYYGTTGHFILDFRSYFENEVYTRTYGLRVGLGTFGNIMIPYNFYLLNNRENRFKLFNIVQLVLGIYCVIFIQQTRAWIIVIGLSLAVQIFFSTKKLRVKIPQLIIMLFVIIVLYASNFLQDIINNFIGVDIIEGNISFNNRIYAITYYLACFRKNIFFGNGLAWCDYGSPYYQIEHGTLGKAYYSDVGILGLLGKTGLCLISFFIIPIIKIAKNLKMTLKRSPYSDEKQFSVAFFTYIVVSSLTLIITDMSRCLLLPVAIAYFAYEANKVGENRC